MSSINQRDILSNKDKTPEQRNVTQLKSNLLNIIKSNHFDNILKYAGNGLTDSGRITFFAAFKIFAEAVAIVVTNITSVYAIYKGYNKGYFDNVEGFNQLLNDNEFSAIISNKAKVLGEIMEDKLGVKKEFFPSLLDSLKNDKDLLIEFKGAADHIKNGKFDENNAQFFINLISKKSLQAPLKILAESISSNSFVEKIGIILETNNALIPNKSEIKAILSAIEENKLPLKLLDSLQNTKYARTKSKSLAFELIMNQNDPNELIHTLIKGVNFLGQDSMTDFRIALQSMLRDDKIQNIIKSYNVDDLIINAILPELDLKSKAKVSPGINILINLGIDLLYNIGDIEPVLESIGKGEYPLYSISKSLEVVLKNQEAVATLANGREELTNLLHIVSKSNLLSETLLYLDLDPDTLQIIKPALLDLQSSKKFLDGINDGDIKKISESIIELALTENTSAKEMRGYLKNNEEFSMNVAKFAANQIVANLQFNEELDEKKLAEALGCQITGKTRSDRIDELKVPLTTLANKVIGPITHNLERDKDKLQDLLCGFQKEAFSVLKNNNKIYEHLKNEYIQRDLQIVSSALKYLSSNKELNDLLKNDKMVKGILDGPISEIGIGGYNIKWLSEQIGSTPSEMLNGLLGKAEYFAQNDKFKTVENFYESVAKRENLNILNSGMKLMLEAGIPCVLNNALNKKVYDTVNYGKDVISNQIHNATDYGKSAVNSAYSAASSIYNAILGNSPSKKENQSSFVDKIKNKDNNTGPTR